MDDEDATLLEEALRDENEPLPPPTFRTDGIFLSERMLAEIASNPSKYLNRRISRKDPPQSVE